MEYIDGKVGIVFSPEKVNGHKCVLYLKQWKLVWRGDPDCFFMLRLTIRMTCWDWWTRSSSLSSSVRSEMHRAHRRAAQSLAAIWARADYDLVASAWSAATSLHGSPKGSPRWATGHYQAMIDSTPQQSMLKPVIHGKHQPEIRYSLFVSCRSQRDQIVGTLSGPTSSGGLVLKKFTRYAIELRESTDDPVLRLIELSKLSSPCYKLCVLDSLLCDRHSHELKWELNEY